MPKGYYIKVPTWSPTLLWHYSTFATKVEWREYVKSLFKEPGLYNLDEVSYRFNEHARTFNKKRMFCEAPEGSRDYQEFWDTEKEKCCKGVIFKNDNGGEWYLTRWYYHWLNFLQIYNKRRKVFAFADVMDHQYHVCLYEMCAILHNKDEAALKKRQMAWSYLHEARMYNHYIFDSGFVGKMMASDKKYINATGGEWKYLEEYHNFNNTNTAWACSNNPHKEFSWQQKVEQKTPDGRKIFIGTKSTVSGITLDKDPVSGVGGACMAKGTGVIMSDGSIRSIENIKVGDIVIGADGLPKRIQKTCSGISQMYNVIQSRGMSYCVTGNHLLYLWNWENKRYITIKAEDHVHISENRMNVCKGVKFKGIEGTKQNLPIDPYYLGAYLGDGDKYNFRILVNKTRDCEIHNYIHELVQYYPDYEVASIYKNHHRLDYKDDMYNMKIVNRLKGRNRSIFHTTFKTLNLREKHIPEQYYTASRVQRLELLAGIIDTDGYYAKEKHRYEITIKTKRLADCVIKLSRQLGMNTQVCIITSSGRTSTVYNKPSTCYRVNITGDIISIPCKVKRKKAQSVSKIACDNYSTLKVEYAGEGEYYGFQCEDNLYCIEDGTITHNCDLAIYVEGGIAPTANITHGFMKPAMRDGAIKTGSFNIGGSVGDLEQCEPLKDMIKNPESHDIYTIKSTLTDENGTEEYTALFIPEQWGYVGENENDNCVDHYGNSLVEKALNLLNEKYAKLKVSQKYEDYQLAVSQGPRYIDEAFAIRKSSVFPAKHTGRQIKRIEDKELYLTEIDLERLDTNEIKVKKAERPPNTYPTSRTANDKRGCIVIHVHPGKDPAWGRFYASVDPVEVGATDSSDSLAAIYVYMNPMEVTNVDENGASTTYIEGGKLAAEWIGRYDDPDDNHEQISLLMEYYNAWTILENNKTSFITYMKLKKRIRYLAPKTEMLFDKEIDVTQNSKTPYGWTKTPAMWKKLLEYGVNFLSEELDEQRNEEGKVTKVVYGVERIPFIWLLKEMQQYDPKKNFDRISAYCPLIAFAKIQEAAQGIKKRTIQPESTTNNKKIRTFDRQSFLKSIGNPNSKGMTQRGLTFKSIGK